MKKLIHKKSYEGRNGVMILNYLKELEIEKQKNVNFIFHIWQFLHFYFKVCNEFFQIGILKKRTIANVNIINTLCQCYYHPNR